MESESACQELNDTALIARYRTESPHATQAFGELMRRHERYVFNTCYRYLGSEADAEDCTQEVFLNVLQTLQTFEGRSQFRTWLFRITMNHCHRIKEKRKRYVNPNHYGDSEEDRDFFDTLPDDASPETVLTADDERHHVRRVLLQLGEQDVKILKLRFMGELSLEDIAETLNIKPSATKMRFYRAIEHFKKAYEQTMQGEAVSAAG